MITDSKICRLVFKVFSLFCLIAILVCFICDIAIVRGVTWSWYPFISVLFAWAVITPVLLAKRHRVLSSFAAVTAFTIPFLFALERLTPVQGWFTVLGLPVAVTGIIALWISYVLIRFARLNLWHKLAALVFLYGIAVSTVANYCADKFAGAGYIGTVNIIINILFSGVAMALLIILGCYKNANIKLVKQQEDAD